jgi:catechol 2,3-dioxygenase-like lactoylglutathione lyase family enzyme
MFRMSPLVGEIVVVVVGAAVDEGVDEGDDDDLPLLQAAANNTPRHTIEPPRVFTADIVGPAPAHSASAGHTARVAFISRVAIVVDEYDPAIAFFVGVLGFELVEDTPATTGDGRPKRWVVVRPPGAETGILLARADNDDQAAYVGRQAGGRVGFFLQVDDFDATYARMRAAGVEFVGAPRAESYGRVAVFVDVAGNRWDLLGA